MVWVSVSLEPGPRVQLDPGGAFRHTPATLASCQTAAVWQAVTYRDARDHPCATRASICSPPKSVSEGHPDKVADRISDTVLDAFLAADPYSRVACETLVTTNRVVLAGETRGPETVTPELLDASRAHGDPRHRL